MSTEIYEHLIAWGCPSDYARDYPTADVPSEYRPVLHRVVAAANWYPEETAAIAAMVRARDADALESWNRDALVAIGRDTSDDDDDGTEYADDIMSALSDLAGVVRETRA